MLCTLAEGLRRIMADWWPIGDARVSESGVFVNLGFYGNERK